MIATKHFKIYSDKYDDFIDIEVENNVLHIINGGDDEEENTRLKALVRECLLEDKLKDFQLFKGNISFTDLNDLSLASRLFLDEILSLIKIRKGNAHREILEVPEIKNVQDAFEWVSDVVYTFNREAMRPDSYILKDSLKKVSYALPLPPNFDEDKGEYTCPICGLPLYFGKEYCPHCNKVINWDEEEAVAVED